ncbi:MAG: amidohydrolase family protein [Oscillospiraceae bacterium]|jgi:predicted TIM-barrel fold metal-dependent hydrolase|nr:amidohydrolase family protein [Oscillospiraceae bacterium]
MVIDFHTHVFPDELAPKAMKALTEEIDNIYPPVSDGTVGGLLKNMDGWGIDISVIQPVVTKQSQMKKANEFAASVQSDRIISFGGIYPHTDDYKRDIDFVAGLGLKGLKFHAEYQDFILDGERMLKIYDYALGKGLILLHHAGYDPAFKPPFKSSPQMFLNVAKAMRGGVMIAAHLGGHAQWDEVETVLAGSGLYLDTSMGFEYFPRDQFLRILDKHGADKILFASDAPWSSAGTEIGHLRALPLPAETVDAILGGNARRILGMDCPS